MAIKTIATILALVATSAAVDFGPNNWAHRCDFIRRDLTNARTTDEQCGGRCAATSGCTHFTWTSYEGGTCWMKYGPVSAKDAVPSSDLSSVCGFISSGPPGQGNVLATRHGATEFGACMLPDASYTVTNPVALGNIASLGNLKYTNAMCGHILTINCGHGSLDIIVTNSNLGGGLDLYGSTWGKATGNKPPGETYCSVQMTNKNPINVNRPLCYYEPFSEKNNQYFKLLALFNTGDKIVTSAKLDGKSGSFNGVQPYFAFYGGPISGSAKVTFGFQDGSSHTVNIGDCIAQNTPRTWS